MSEQKQSYMSELDKWTEETILTPLAEAWLGYYETPGQEFKDRVQEVKAETQKRIREKVLESYRNGQAAGPAKRYFGK